MHKRPICAKCECEMRPEKNDIRVIDYFSKPPIPYKIWCADLWKCPICGVELVIGFGRDPLTEHWEENFAEVLELCMKNERVINNFEGGRK